ncbi:MAG: hypothetical protein J5912_06750 [Clostridia bacterium]|nr:hypothetical protein [Clostridia bacterium]
MSDNKSDVITENGPEQGDAADATGKKAGGKSVFKNPKFWIVAGVAVVLAAAIVTVSLVLWKHDKGGTPGVKFYGFTDLIDYKDYVPEAQANSLLAHGGLAFEAGAPNIYKDGAYADVSGSVSEGNPVASYSDGVMSVNADLLGSLTGTDCGSGTVTLADVASKLNKDAYIYENRLCVLLDKGLDVSVFDNYYTFEWISLKLRGAGTEDLENALVTLPYTVSNGENYVVRYTDSDLELGLSTEIYAAQGYGKSDGVLDARTERPRIVAGEGENKKNHTLVRVYNEYSAKTAQFLAFPYNVTGGVKVECAYVNYQGADRPVIATAAFNGSFREAKSVRIFDENGILYMEIVPGFSKEAPYNIVTGNFLAGRDQLLIMPVKADGEGDIKCEIYLLEDGSKAYEGVIKAGAECADHGFTAALVNAGEHDALVLMDNETRAIFTVSYDASAGFSIAGTKAVADLNANGIAQSAFSKGGFAVSIDVDEQNAHRAFLRLFTDGNDVYGTKTDVGVYENIFFWDTADSNLKLKGLKSLTIQDTDYVRKASFQHIRTDLAAKAISSLTGKKVAKLGTLGYSDWKWSGKIRNYSLTYNVWEPCFTHRFNIIPGTTILSKITDEDGFLRYLGYTNDNTTANYEELGSQFYNATYAEGIIELDKMRLYPLRGSLQALYENFVTDPEKLAGLEPIHEIEINVGETFGDYNPHNIEGFRSYLLERFGSVENINKKFGTPFTSREDIDAPRNGALGDRGAWDLFEGGFFEQWALFTRKVINKRLTEAFREALLAGFPSEIISGHSIPEGDAISGFLGQADTRMSPVDAMMTLGCHFGATRYGTWFQDDRNFLNLAYSAGFKNITMGEYNSMSDETTDIAARQLEYVWWHGAKFINVLNVSDSGTRADLRAISALAEKNEPRPGYAEGTTESLAVKSGDKAYQIVEMGGNGNNTGLLKSVNADGTWTGDVYLVPFHTHIEVERLSLGTNPRAGSTTSNIGDLQTGDIIEINFIGSYNGEGAELVIEFYEDEILNEKMSQRFALSKDTKVYKYVLSNQVPLGNVKLKVRFDCDDYSAVNIEDLNGTVQRESVARKYFGDYTATEHAGGVSFDIITRELLYGN